MDKAMKFFAVVALFAITGCATTGGSLCPAGPIILDKSDVLSRSTAEQVVALNESGQKICGWHSPA